MKIRIKKADYALGLLPWCPYLKGFWFNLSKGMSGFNWMGYQIFIYKGI